MNLSHAIPEDELALARLTAAKLAKVMHGLMSVGTASLELPSPTKFLAGREKTPLGFLEVLRCIGVNHSHADQLPVLRSQVDQLAELTNRFQGEFIQLANWRNTSAQDVHATVERLGECYSQFCSRLENFCAMLGMDVDYSAQARSDRAGLEGMFSAVAVLPS